ncbi:arsenic resistance protein [Haliovirga abyssi]|uniref:Bile acid:sodium symporter n=1 Tax=Haliovirga abyssi TaxID=2996794 RepID=A0AAU9DCB6_9FUSO|nr:bile acid:sodium symporter [Haliovirga abyssi]BDU49937.1 bile acid:sodium symporter [Haliovirga abyssi]
MIKKIQKNLSGNMLIYTFLVMIGGFGVGYIFPNAKKLSTYILPIVFIMIYPMMINISLASLKKIKGSTKPLIEATILNFIYAPAFLYILTSIFIADPRIKLALMLLAVAPASSMGLGYIGLAEGHMVTGAIIVAVAFILSIFVYPIAGSYFAAGANIVLPLPLMLKNLGVILILPLALGIITRELIMKKHDEKVYNSKFKPVFSVVTLASLYLLMFTIFASKADLIIKNYKAIIMIAPVAIIYYTVTIFFTIYMNKTVLKFEYGHHQAVVFTSVSKNIALTIAIIIAIFGKDGQYMAIAPAIMSLFQPIFLMTYLKSSGKVKKHFNVSKN